MTEKKFDFSAISPDQQRELLEIHRRTLGYSLANQASGDRSPQTKMDIDDSRRAISRLMRLLGVSHADQKDGVNVLRVLIESEPPGADVTLDGQPLIESRTPCFVEITPGKHVISTHLAGHSAESQNQIHCNVIEGADSLEMELGTQSADTHPVDEPIIKFLFKRKEASIVILTEPEIPGAEISIRGIDEHNRHIEIDAFTDDNGKLELPNSGKNRFSSEAHNTDKLITGSYLAEGRWRPFFGFFAQFSFPKRRTVKLSGDMHKEQVGIQFALSIPFSIWRSVLVSKPSAWLRTSRLIQRFKSLPLLQRQRLVYRFFVTIGILIPLFWLFWDWHTSTRSPSEMVAIQGAMVGSVTFVDPVSNNLRKWLGDEGSQVWGNVLGSIVQQAELKKIDRFAIDRYEVSVSDYKIFLMSYGDKYSPKGVERWEEFEELPVVGINWFDAKDYCEFVGKRLPTAAEWQAAAGGGVVNAQGRIPLFPWGDEFDSDRCNVHESPFRGILPVHSEDLCPTTFEPSDNGKATPEKCWTSFGVCSMVGNASEWVDEHRIVVAGAIVEEQIDEHRKVRRRQLSLVRKYAYMGGSFLDTGRLMGMVFSRSYIEPDIKLTQVGVRCAKDLLEKEEVPDGMVGLGPFNESRNGPPELPYVLPLRGLDTDRASEVLGQILNFILSPHSNARADDFFLDIHPVSEGEYQDFIRFTGGRRGPWSHPRQPQSKQSYALGNLQGAPDEPIQNVDWWDAYAYCNWRGKRLPKRIELEIAYSGNSSTTYPWGNVFKRDSLMRYESKYGIEGLVAPFTEWTQDFARGPLVKVENARIIRGGILASELTEKVYSMTNFHVYANANNASSGFRCASDVSESTLTKFGKLIFGADE